MRLGIIGAGHVGGNIARLAALAGYDVTVSFARDRANLTAPATELGGTAGEAQAGSLAGRIVIDTTNQFGRGVAASLNGRTAACYNADRMPGASYTKCFNTLTAGFQAAAATRTGDARVVQWIAGGDSPAKTTVAELVEAVGYVAIDLADIDSCGVMEAPRRPGAVYGEEYRHADADA